MTPKQGARGSRASINVGGTVYTVDTDTIMKYPTTMLGVMLSTRWEESRSEDDEFFLDRDPVRFRYILDFYRDGTICIPLTMSKKEMLREADYFALPVTDIQFDWDDQDAAGIQRAVIKHQFKQEAHKSVMVACAYELALLHIGKLESNPGSESLSLFLTDIPKSSFAHSLCPAVLDEPVFKEAITSLVAECGYSYVGEITNSNFVLSRSAPW